MKPEETENVASEAQQIVPPEEVSEQLAGAESEPDMSLVVTQRRTVSRSTLVTFAILVIGAAGVYFMHRQTGPKTANAAAARQKIEAGKTISDFLSGGDSSIRLMETMLRNTEKVVQQFLAYPSMTQVPLSDLRTNPFRQHSLQPKQSAESRSDANEKRKREEERLAVLNAVQGLQLQSIMCSDTRRACMINNAMYREGQVVDNFTIEKISPSSVVVKNGPYRFELKIQR